jgi:probable addiction module antidote protein
MTQTKTKTLTKPWDTAEHLKTDEDIAAYLEAAVEEGDARLLVVAIGNVARAKGMTLIAKEAGVSREALYRALSPYGNPEFATVAKVLQAMGYKLHVKPAAYRATGPGSEGSFDIRHADGSISKAGVIQVRKGPGKGEMIAHRVTPRRSASKVPASGGGGTAARAKRAASASTLAKTKKKK